MRIPIFSRIPGKEGRQTDGRQIEGRQTSIKRQFMFFSALLFVAVLAGGSAAFIVSMRQILRTNTGNELQKTAEIERNKVVALVNGEIEQLALEEIAAYRRAFAANTVFWVNDSDKRFFLDSNYAYTVNTQDKAAYWYQLTLEKTEKYNFNINYNAELKKTALWINAPVFNTQSGAAKKPVGMMGTGIDLSAFIDSVYRGYTGAAELYFFNAEGEITGAKNAGLAADKTKITEKLGKTGMEIVSRAR